MSIFRQLKVSHRLTAITGFALIMLAVLAFTTWRGQAKLAAHSEHLHEIELATADLNHLDTREAELKVDAYRSLLESDLKDIVADLPDDVTSATDTLAALEETRHSLRCLSWPSN